MAKEANWNGKGLLCDHMAEVERKAGPVTLECLAYRALRWKYGEKIPDYLSHLKEPLGYPDDYQAVSIEKIYDQAISVGLKTRERVFMKHGFWGALSSFKKLKSKAKNGKIPYEDYLNCFICYIKRKFGYYFIEGDIPHDRYFAVCCNQLHFFKLHIDDEDFEPEDYYDDSDDSSDTECDKMRRLFIHVSEYLKRPHRRKIYINDVLYY